MSTRDTNTINEQSKNEVQMQQTAIHHGGQIRIVWSQIGFQDVPTNKYKVCFMWNTDVVPN